MGRVRARKAFQAPDKIKIESGTRIEPSSKVGPILGAARIARIRSEKVSRTVTISPFAARRTLALRSARGGYSRTGVK